VINSYTKNGEFYTEEVKRGVAIFISIDFLYARHKKFLSLKEAGKKNLCLSSHSLIGRCYYCYHRCNLNLKVKVHLTSIINDRHLYTAFGVHVHVIIEVPTTEASTPMNTYYNR